MHFLVISSGCIFHSGPACPNQPFYAKVHPGICQSDNWRTKNAPFPHHPLSLHWLIGWRNDDFYLAIKSLYYQHKVGLIPSSQNIHIVSSFFLVKSNTAEKQFKASVSKKEKRHKLISYFPMQTARHHCWPSVNENKTQRLPPWLCISFQHCWSLNDWLLIFSLGRNNMEDQKMIDPVDNHLCICYWKRCAAPIVRK